MSRPTSPSAPVTAARGTPEVTSKTAAGPAVAVPAALSIAAENKRPGTAAWNITTPAIAGDYIEGYSGRTSYQQGEAVDLHVDTPAATWHAEVYRMGDYQGKRARLVVRSSDGPGVRQPPKKFLQSTNTAEANWPVTLTLTVTADWTPGAYLVKLVSSKGSQGWVPVTIIDPASRADLLVVQSVATWQAYNDWGLCNLYKCTGAAAGQATGSHGVARAQVVSFNRPYARSYHHGSADFTTHELPLIAMIESLGLSVTYITDIDLNEHPEWASNHNAVITLGHAEYYSTQMYDALEKARDRGTNLAFFGANAVYRHVRFEPGADGAANRRMVNYRSTSDPAARIDPKNATVEWRSAPLNKPENALIGIMYGCASSGGSMVISNSRHWVWGGTNVHDGTVLPKLIGTEYDKVYANGFTPKGLQLLSVSPVRCNGRSDVANSSYYEAPSGAGVFASGTIWWIQDLDPEFTNNAEAAVVRRATQNVLQRFAFGTAATALFFQGLPSHSGRLATEAS